MTHYTALDNQLKKNDNVFIFKLDQWKQLDRFLILGQEGSTYYATEREIVRDNCNVLRACMEEDGCRVVDRIVEISESGRAPKNDPAIFCLAQVAGHKDPKVRAYALAALPKVCRIGTHLFGFAEDVLKSRRWGRGLRNAVSSWYTNRELKDLALQTIKYQQRNGWSNRDLLRLSHAKATSPGMEATFRWIVGGKDAVFDKERKGGDLSNHLPELIQAFDEVQRTEEEDQVCALIAKHNLPREAVPTKWLNSVKVWEALLPHMGMTAMIRNLGKMTAVGLLKPLSEESKMVRDALTNQDKIRKARVHPMQFLLASGIYNQGHGDKGKLTWTPNQMIVDALDEGFNLAFATVEPTGKNMLLALDVSPSMGGGLIAGAPGITPKKAAAAMAMITLRSEKNCHIVGFNDKLFPLNLSPKDSLAAVEQKLTNLNWGATDCARPMLYAAAQNLNVDVFHIYTDNDTNYGWVAPSQALKDYRNKSGIDAKLCVAAFTATNRTIADPSDGGMLDVVGMDAQVPRLMADFARGTF